MRSDTALRPPVRPFASCRVRLTLPAALAIVLSGCADRPSNPDRRTESGRASETIANEAPVLRPETSQPFTVSLEKIDEAGLAKAIQNHRGNVVLVNFWATWCLPCVKMLPHTVALQRDRGKRGLNVITVSMDDPDEEAGVRRTLEQNQAITENYLNHYEGSTEAVEHFQLPEALPHIRIYDRMGRLRQSFPIAKKPFSPKGRQPCDRGTSRRAGGRLTRALTASLARYFTNCPARRIAKGAHETQLMISWLSDRNGSSGPNVTPVWRPACSGHLRSRKPSTIIASTE